MTLKKSVLISLATLSLGASLTTLTITATAKTYTTIPVSLRGKWYHRNSDGTYDRVFFTKYHYDFPNGDGSWTKISGAKFPSYAMGHSQLFVSKRNSKGYYNIGTYASDEWPYWKRTTHNHSRALLMYNPLPPYDYFAEYYYPLSYYKKTTYKAFHGYRIEGYKSLYTYNTFYDKETHSTISDYAPTKTSKIIFEYGSHVYPTQHTWSRVWGKGNRYVTDYKYYNGAWHQDGKTFDTKAN